MAMLTSDMGITLEQFREVSPRFSCEAKLLGCSEYVTVCSVLRSFWLHNVLVW
jgi:hypothetical protein